MTNTSQPDSGTQPALTRHHATIFVDAAIAEPLETIRHAWDAGMVAQIPAHVTLIYPEEARNVELLLERVEQATKHAAPFRLKLGGMAYFGRPDDGIYVEVADCDGGYAALRQQILQPPFTAYEFPLHVTLIHPRTSSRGGEFWRTGERTVFDTIWTVRSVAITAFDGTTWATVAAFPLGG